jgi:hypothetical protein
MLTLSELNSRHEQFWALQSKLTLERISNGELFEFAQKDMDSEIIRGVPVKHRKTFELALADAEQGTRLVRQRFSRMGGKAHKQDALQRLIVEKVQQNPKVHQQELFHSLRADIGKGTIVSMDVQSNTIQFWTETGKLKTVSLSGLKDRLSKARRQK